MRQFRLFVLITVLASVSLPSTVSSDAASADSCRFVLGFKTIHDLIPGVVGTCLANEHYNPTNGDALQETTNGLLVWRKSDNFTVFTDGHRSWVNGPFGLRMRLNTQRFPWESDAARFPPAPEQLCDPSYPTVCIPPPPPDLDCQDIPFRDFTVLPLDPHRLDGDNDRIGCET